MIFQVSVFNGNISLSATFPSNNAPFVDAVGATPFLSNLKCGLSVDSNLHYYHDNNQKIV